MGTRRTAAPNVRCRALHRLSALPALVALLGLAMWTTASSGPASSGGPDRLSPSPIDAAVLFEELVDRANGDDADSRWAGGPGSPAGKPRPRVLDPFGAPVPVAAVWPALSRSRLERAGRLGHPSTAPPSPS